MASIMTWRTPPLTSQDLLTAGRLPTPAIRAFGWLADILRSGAAAEERKDSRDGNEQAV